MKPFKNLEEQTIEFLDERFYKIGEEYYPSVTHILNLFPKGVAFEQWLKDVGNQAKAIAQRAADSGIKVHEAVGGLVGGQEVVWDEKKYDLEEWKGVMRGADFLEGFVEKVEANEAIIHSDTYQYAGRLDLVVIIKGERWLIDIKFGNAVYPNYFLQIAAYEAAWHEMGGKLIDRIGILWLKAKTRGRDSKEKKIQGEGWQLVEAQDQAHYRKLMEIYDKDESELLFEQFQRTLNTYKFLNPEIKPKNLIYPMQLKIDKFIKTEEL